MTTETPDAGPITFTRIPDPPTAPTAPTAPKRSRYRDPVFWVLAAVTATSLALGALAVTTHDDEDPAHRASDDRTYVVDGYADELDLALMTSDVEGSRDLLSDAAIAARDSGPAMIPARTALPDSVTLTGDDACKLAGGTVILQSDPPACDVDIPSALGLGGGR